MEWISIEEELPEDGERILIYFDLWSSGEFGYVLQHYYEPGDFFSKKFIHGFETKKITHWAVLKQPHKDHEADN